MVVTVKNKKSFIIDDSVLRQMLGLYPEEGLINRPVFVEAFRSGSIEFRDLKDESDKILMPWQMFLLNSDNLRREMLHINKMRADKLSPKLLAKRKGVGGVTSKRIIDRLIRLQNFLSTQKDLSRNTFCGSLTRMTVKDAAVYITSHFGIDLAEFRGRNKVAALSYLLEKIESKQINVSLGVLANKMLPHSKVVNGAIYKNTSGFAIKDDYFPFVFLPSEVNPDEVEGRQIYSLVYLLVVIGLNQFNFFIEKDFKVKAISATGSQKKIYDITSEFLLPSTETEKLKGVSISKDLRDELATNYKMTPTAVVVTLRLRKILTSNKQYEDLLPAPYKPGQRGDKHPRNPAVKTSVRKFCGKYSFEFVNAGLSNGSLSNIQAQYLLFGYVNKKGFLDYRRYLKI